MLAIKVNTENGLSVLRPSQARLGALVRRIGGEGERFLVVQRVPDLPHVFVQVWHEAGGEYLLEHRAGRPDEQFEARFDGPEPVIAAMAAWAAGAPEWDAGIAWSALDLPAPEPVPPLDLPEEDHRVLVERIRTSIAGGYADREELAEVAEEHLVVGDVRPVSHAQAAELVDRMWLEGVAAQAGWEGETDPERLTRAFTALEAAGITAREHFTCCRSCGRAEIGGEAEQDSRGFVYFHSQGTDAAASGHGLTLYYGGFDDSAATTTAVGHEVVAALNAAGLPAEWSGDPSRAISVTPLDWRRRLVG